MIGGYDHHFGDRNGPVSRVLILGGIMDLSADFVFQPLPPIEPAAAAAVAPDAVGGGPLGQLANLSGSWSGTGFNTIWRPHHPGQDHFLELNVTAEELTFSAIPGAIPNRGLLQNDITMHGL